MDELLQNFERHLRETLSLSVTPKKWAEANNLPFFLKDQYAFFQVSLLDTPCLLMVTRDKEEQPPATIRKQMLQVRGKWSGEVVYVCPSATAYNRKRLIEQKVSFVVPGNQMYLPLLGIDLREHFKQIRAGAPGKFSPSTQAVVMYHLLNGTGQSYTPSRLEKLLRYVGYDNAEKKYSAMTLTRTFDELQSLGLGNVAAEGRERVLHFGEDKRKLWEQAREFMRSPVTRRVYIQPVKKRWAGVAAGLSALAHYSMLVPPANPVYALGTNDWKVMKILNTIVELSVEEPQSYEVEIWNYSPLLFQKNGVVDHFSLYLSLKDSTDDRVQSALEKMMEDIAW